MAQLDRSVGREATGAQDGRLARERLLEAFEVAYLAGEMIRGEAAAPMLTLAEALLRDVGRPTLGDLLLHGFVTLHRHGHAAAAPSLRQAATRVARLSAADVPDAETLRWSSLGALAAHALWDVELSARVARRWVAAARQAGAVRALPAALAHLSWIEMEEGDFDAAGRALDASAEAAKAIRGAADRTAWPRLMLLARRGREAEARAAAEAMRREATAELACRARYRIAYALVPLELGLGRYEAARAGAAIVFDNDPRYVGSWVLADHVEAAVRSGNREEAARVLARLEERAAVAATDHARGLLHRSRALLAAEGDAEQLYREAIDCLQPTAATPELARSHLLYGEWLLRRQRRRDAREQLCRAHRLLSDIGAEAFAERARAGLSTARPGDRRRR